MLDIDIDSLHKKIAELEKGNYSPRGSGQTFAKLMLLLGELELGDDNTQHLVITPTFSYANHVCKMFCKILDEYEIKWQFKMHANVLVFQGNKIVKFVGFTDLEEQTRGNRFRSITCDIPDECVDVPTNLRQYIRSILVEDFYQI